MDAPPVGRHLLSELSQCKRVTTVSKHILQELVMQLLLEHCLTPLGTFLYEFEGGGITAFFGLAESHIAVHSWPEFAYVTLEVYVCNHTKDNAVSAQQIHTALVAFFEPEQIRTTDLYR